MIREDWTTTEGVGGRLRYPMNRQAKLWRPPTDVYETGDSIVVRVEVAGMEETDFQIELVKRTLVISGCRIDHSSTHKIAYQQMEITYGEFSTEVYLPWPVNAGSVEATYRDGFLQVLLPKARAHRVPIGRTAEEEDINGQE
jgi:HSP20 family protein